MSTLTIKIDTDDDVVEIEGIRYGFEVFKAFAPVGLKEGEVFSVVKRLDDTLIVRRYSSEINEKILEIINEFDGI